MNKQTLLTAVFITVIFLSAVWFLGSKSSSSLPSEEAIVLYYGDTCSHCKELDELISKNNIREKVTFVEKEVFVNQKNAKELDVVAQKCGITSSNVGVPFLYMEGKCLIGTPDIFDYLSKKAAASANRVVQ